MLLQPEPNLLASLANNEFRRKRRQMARSNPESYLESRAKGIAPYRSINLKEFDQHRKDHEKTKRCTAFFRCKPLILCDIGDYEISRTIAESTK
ncbi:hypothetical protein, partial [Persicirhabdus sediminis]|uniref:hypothetical protein n=1 Tax=Persicirhabdus sediminis TaxID=454144 RepID=UPI001F1F3289